MFELYVTYIRCQHVLAHLPESRLQQSAEISGNSSLQQVVKATEFPMTAMRRAAPQALDGQEDSGAKKLWGRSKPQLRALAICSEFSNFSIMMRNCRDYFLVHACLRFQSAQ
jgi:hypothetical protein